MLVPRSLTLRQRGRGGGRGGGKEEGGERGRGGDGGEDDGLKPVAVIVFRTVINGALVVLFARCDWFLKLGISSDIHLLAVSGENGARTPFYQKIK